MTAIGAATAAATKSCGVRYWLFETLEAFRGSAKEHSREHDSWFLGKPDIYMLVRPGFSRNQLRLRGTLQTTICLRASATANFSQFTLGVD
jgi:hypothetical protein